MRHEIHTNNDDNNNKHVMQKKKKENFIQSIKPHYNDPNVQKKGGK